MRRSAARSSEFGVGDDVPRDVLRAAQRQCAEQLAAQAAACLSTSEAGLKALEQAGTSGARSSPGCRRPPPRTHPARGRRAAPAELRERLKAMLAGADRSPPPAARPRRRSSRSTRRQQLRASRPRGAGERGGGRAGQGPRPRRVPVARRRVPACVRRTRSARSRPARERDRSRRLSPSCSRSRAGVAEEPAPVWEQAESRTRRRSPPATARTGARCGWAAPRPAATSSGSSPTRWRARAGRGRLPGEGAGGPGRRLRVEPAEHDAVGLRAGRPAGGGRRGGELPPAGDDAGPLHARAQRCVEGQHAVRAAPTRLGRVDRSGPGHLDPVRG